MAKYDFPIGAANLFARIDVFNLFDNSGVREVDEFAELDSGVINQHWREPTHYQRPRSVRIGLGVTF
jgi:hypothetical protein